MALPCPLWPASAATPPAQVSFHDTIIRSSEHDCAWTLTSQFSLPIAPDYTHVLFHYDVNGDGVDDFFVAPDPQYITKVDKTITLVVSKIDGGVLSFEPTGCNLAAPLGYGRYRLRDIDGDGVTDFVFATGDGIRVILNRPGGPQTTIAYDFPNRTVLGPYLEDVALGAFDKDGASELAVGFSRITGEVTAQTESGTVLFPRPTQPSTQAPVELAFTRLAGNGLDIAYNGQIGIFASLQGGRALFGASTQYGWLYQNGTKTTKRIGVYEDPSYLGAVTIGGKERVLGYFGEASYVFDPQAPDSGTTIQSAPGSSAARLLDVDGDGDLDLVELGGTGVPRFFIHNGDATNGPSAEWQSLYASQFYAPTAETPFLAIGAMKGRLLVSDGNPGDTKDLPLVVGALGCGP